MGTWDPTVNATAAAALTSTIMADDAVPYELLPEDEEGEYNPVEDVIVPEANTPTSYLVSIQSGSDHSNRAFSLALQIAKPEIDHLHLVHVLSADAWTPITSPDERHAVKEELKGGAIASLKQYRGVAAKEAGFANVSAHLLIHDDTRKGLDAAIEKVNPDVIVMGSRGLSKLKRLVLGSSSQYVLHGTNIPVLIVK